MVVYKSHYRDLVSEFDNSISEHYMQPCMQESGSVQSAIASCAADPTHKSIVVLLLLYAKDYY